MSESETEKSKIYIYMLEALSDELDETNQIGDDSNSNRTDVDPYSKFVYDRIRELYWTLSRPLKWLTSRLIKFKKATVPLERGVTLTGDIPASPASGRLLIDMTNTVETGAATGIQRVVREIARHCVETGAGVPVLIEGGRMLPYYRHSALPRTIEPAAGDVLLVLDASWNRFADYPPIMRAMKACGGKSIVGVYDILPLSYPWLFKPLTVQNFRAWYAQILLQADAVVAISRASAESLLGFLRGDALKPASALPIGWWPLGADFCVEVTGEASEKARSTAAGAPYFLSVGTLEPRKGYPVAIEAFERLWATGVDVRYVIVGRPGWNTRALQARLRQHKEFDSRLFWFDDASDADLRVLYSHARGAVLASVAEGFGLPLVEAAFHGVSTIASDIPVFREVGGDGARYFKLLDSASLATRIQEMLAQPKTAPALKVTSWRESTERLVQLIREEAYQLRFN
jgi:glycosyltransferase involved in cell wall biosynthesis